MTHPEATALDDQIAKLKTEIKEQMLTVERLNAEHHECPDAAQQLDGLLRKYSALVETRYTPMSR